MTLLYFAWLRERLGLQEEQFALPEGVGTVAQLTALLQARGPVWQEALGPSVRCAVNQVFATPQTPVGTADEVAYFPPVTGG